VRSVPSANPSKSIVIVAAERGKAVQKINAMSPALRRLTSQLGANCGFAGSGDKDYRNIHVFWRNVNSKVLEGKIPRNFSLRKAAANAQTRNS